MDKITYTVSASNNQGASTSVGIDMDHPNGGRIFTSISAATSAARREMGSGWKIYIVDNFGTEVKSFTIR